MTRISTTTPLTVTVVITGNPLALWLWRMADRCGLTMEARAVTFDEPVQAIADRLAVEAIVEQSRVP